MPFPLHTLPPWLREMVEATAAWAGADVSMAAAASLGAVSAAVGRKGFVELRQSRFPLHVWIMVVGESVDGKSRVFRALAEPIQDVQQRLLAEMGPTEPRDRHTRGDPAIVRVAEGWLNEDAPTRVPGVAPSDVVRAIRGDAPDANATPPRFVVNDITPTALLELIGDHQVGVALISPEGGFESWLTAGGAVASQSTSTLNKAWDAEDYTRDRQGRSVPVARPALTMLVGVQPDVFEGFARHRLLRSRGFTLRFLLFRSDPIQRQYPERQMAERVQRGYAAYIHQLMCLPGWGDDDQPCIPVSTGAAELNDEFMNNIERRVAAGGELCHARPVARRVGANLPRLAGLLHLARQVGVYENAAMRHPIDRDTMHAAVEVAEFFLAEGVAALGNSTAGRELPGDAGEGVVSVVDAVRMFVAARGHWEGRATELLEALCRTVPERQRVRWPRASNQLTRVMREHEAELSASGITMTEARSGRRRTLSLLHVDEDSETGRSD